MNVCNPIPTIDNKGTESRLFKTVLNFKNTFNPDVIKSMGLGLNSIRDLATYLYSIKEGLGTTPGLSRYEDINEIRLESILASLLNDPEIGFNDVTKSVFQTMIDRLNTPLKNVYDPVIKNSSGFRPTDIAYSNRVLAQAYLQVQEAIQNKRLGNGLSLKVEVLNQLNKNINKYADQRDAFRDKFLQNFLIEVMKQDSYVWKSFLSYLKSTYGVNYRNIKHDITLEDMQDSFQTTDDIQEVWDAIRQDKIDRKNTISSIVKSKLAKILNDATSSNSKSNLLYIPDPMDINTIWNQLINLHINDLTLEDVENSLANAALQIESFAKIQDEFNKAKQGDKEALNFRNAYISGVRLAVIPSNIIAIEKPSKSDSFVASIFTNNKNAFSRNAYIDRFISVIDSNLQFGLYPAKTLNSLKAESHAYVNKKRIFDIDYAIDSLMRVYNTLGLAVTRRALQSYSQSTPNVEVAFTKLAQQANYIVGEIKAIKNKKLSLNEYTAQNSDNKGNLYKLADIAAYDFDSLTNLSYLDVKGELNYSPQYDSLLTKLFRGLSLNGQVREAYLLDTFSDYLNDPTLATDNFLVYDINTGMGMFENVDGQWKVSEYFINRVEKGKRFAISQFDGLKLRKTGYKYKELQSTLYKYTEVVANLLENYIFLTSDSPRSFMMSVQHIDTADLYNADGSLNPNAKIYKALQKIADNDINIFERFGSRVFNLDPKNPEHLDQLQRIHNVKYWNGKTVIDGNGIPTGKAFQFKTITYTENSQPKSIIDFIADMESVSVKDVYNDLISSIQNNTVSKYDIRGYISQFIARYIQYANESVATDFSDIAQFILHSSVESNGEVISLLGSELLSEIDVKYQELLQAYVDNSKNEKIKSVDDVQQYLKDRIYEDARTQTLENVNPLESKAFRDGMLKLILNHTVYSNSFNNIINGKLSEYKNTTDYNKRIAQIIKNGLNSVTSDHKRRIVVMSDLNFKNNIAGQLFNEVKGIQQADRVNDTIADLHGGFTTINDSMSIMTDVAFQNLLESTGRWEEYRAIVEDLRNPNKPFNPNAYRKLVEQLKLFGTTRGRRGDFFKADTAIRDETGNIVNDDFANEVDSVQIKDSTIVIFESTTRGQAMGDLYDWMIANQVDQLSPISAVKVSGITPVTIHNENAQLTLPETIDDKHTLYMDSSSFVIQQDIKADILDEVTIVGNQLLKQLTQGLNMTEAIYELNGEKVTGEQIFRELQTVVSNNIQEDSLSLLSELGGIDENGKVNMDENGNIVLSTPKLVKVLQEIVEDDDSSTNIKQALELDNYGMTTMPVSYPVTYKKFEKIFAARFSKRVINQYLPGLHAPLRADIFNAPNILLDKTSKVLLQGDEQYNQAIDELVENGSITYSDDFIARCKAERRSLELRASYGYENGQLTHRAEVILNPWMKEMFNTIPSVKTITNVDGTTKDIISVDINEIPLEARQMLAIRIPTEGKQSMVLFEVVGFLNTGATQAVFPQSLVTQTGWDFDIDTIYAYYKHINFEEGFYTLPKFDATKQAYSNQNQLDLYAAKATISEKYKVQVIADTQRDSLNSPLFDIIIKQFHAKYGDRLTNQTTIKNLKDGIDNAIRLLNSQKGKGNLAVSNNLNQLNKIKQQLNVGLLNLIENTLASAEDVLRTRHYNNNSISAVQSILGRELTQEERLQMFDNLTDNYTSGDNDVFFKQLETVNKNIQKVKKILSKIETNINSLDAVSNESPTGLGVDIVNNLKYIAADLVSGDTIAKLSNGTEKAFNVFDQLEGINNRIQEAVDPDGDYSGYIDALDKTITLERQARDNYILDIATSILGNVYHINETNKPNAMDNIQRVSNRDNALWNRSLDSLNPNNLADKIFLNVVSMGSTILKGHSVNFDNTAAILSTLKANMKSGITRLIDKADLPITKDSNGKVIKQFTDTGKLTTAYKSYLETLYGEKQFRYIPSRNALEVKDRYINNNASGTNTDLAGDPVSFQLSEVTAAILDILKAGLMFNLNTDTLSVFRLLSAGTTTELYYDPTNPNNTNRTPNRFSYASAFIQQPVVVEIVETINREKIGNDYINYKQALAFMYDKYGRMLIDSYNRYKTIDSPLNTQIQNKYNNTATLKLTKEEIGSIQDVLESAKGINYNVDSANNYTTRELISFIQNRTNPDAAYYISQLAVLDMFDNYNDKANKLTQLSFVLKTEGRVDSFYKSDSKELKLADYYMSKDDYKRTLKNTLDVSFEAVQTLEAGLSDDTNKIKELYTDFDRLTVKAFQTKYPNSPKTNFITKATYYQAKNDFSDLLTINDRKNQMEYLNIPYEPVVDFEINGEDLITAIYSGNQLGYVDKSNNTIINNTVTSAYPIIQSRYQFGHWMFANSFGKVFAQRAEGVRKAVTKYLVDNNKSYDEKSRTYVESKIIEYYTQLNGEDQTPLFANVSQSQLKNILGIISDEAKERHNEIASKLFGNINSEVTNEKFKSYTKLTLAEQIKLITTEPSLTAYINQPDFKKANIFNFIQIDRNSRQRNGFDVLRIIRDENNVIANDDIAASVLTMWNSDVPYIAHTIRTLITYTYFTNGFQYGYNLAKYIPMELLNEVAPNPSYDTRILQIGYGDPTIGLSDYTYNLRLAENNMIQGQVADIDDALGYISRQNSDLNIYMPSYNKQVNTDKYNVNIATIGRLMTEPNGEGENVGAMNVTDGDGNPRILYFETRERVNNSMYANNEYLTRKTKYGSIIYRRSEPFNHNSSNPDVDVYIYYPIGKLLKNEFSETSVVDDYNISQEILLDEDRKMDIITYAKQSGELNVFLNTLKYRQQLQTVQSEIENIAADDDGSVDVDEDTIDTTDDTTEENFESADQTDTPLYSQAIPIISGSNTIRLNGSRTSNITSLIENHSDTIYLFDNNSPDTIERNTAMNMVGTYNVHFVDTTLNPLEAAKKISQSLIGSNILILGDSLKGSNYNAIQANQWTSIFLSKLNEITNITNLDTIVNEGFGMALANTFVDNDRTLYTFDNIDNLRSEFVKVNKPLDNSVESRTLNNAIIASDSFRTIKRVINQSRRQVIPNIDKIKEVYRSIDSEDFTGGIQKALEDANAAAVSVAFKKMTSIQISILDGIKDLLSDVHATNFDLVRTDYYKFQEYKQKLNLVTQLLSTFDKFKNVQQIRLEDTLYSKDNPDHVEAFKEEFGEVNDSIKTLQNLYKNSLKYRTEVLDTIQDLQVQQIIADSRNPLFANAFNKILEASRKDEFDPSTFSPSDLSISEVELRQIIASVFTFKNQDINRAQKYLDSAFVTGVPLIDITGKQYIKAVEASKRKAESINDRLEEALEKVDAKLVKNAEYRANYFRKFVTTDGDLIDTYNRAEVDEAVRVLQADINDILTKEYFSSGFYISDVQSRAIQKMINDRINQFNKSAKGLVYKLPDSALAVMLAETQNLTDAERNSYMKLNNYIELKFIDKVGDKPTSTIFKLDFKESAKDPRYAVLSETDQVFIKTVKDLIQETIHEYNPTYIPYASDLANVFPFLKQSSLKDQANAYFRMPRVREDQTFDTIDGHKQYYLEAHSLTTPEVYKSFNVRSKYAGETWEEYEADVLKAFNKWKDSGRKKLDTKGIKTIRDIRDFNRKTNIENKRASIPNRSYDIVDVMKAFTGELFNIKAVNDFQQDYNLAQYTLEQNNGREHLKNAMEQFDNIQKRVYNTSKVNGTVDVFSQALLRYSSINYMYGNYTAGIKNVLKGVSDMIIEISSEGFVDAKSMRQGMAEIIRVIPKWVQQLRTERTDDLMVAIVKNFEGIYQDSRDIYSSLTGTGYLTKALSTVDSIGYAPNTMGEFIMQFGMLLACVKSHKVVGGRVISFGDYYDQEKTRILSELLTEKQKAEYYKFREAKDAEIKKYERKKDRAYNWDHDYAGEFLRMNPDLLTDDQWKAYVKASKLNKQAYKNKFEKLPSLQDSLEVKDGRLAPKDGSGLNIDSLTEFRERVKGINQALHGIYNRVDRMALQDYATGELFAQFRKWMRPNYVRYFGRRFNSNFFNETLGAWETPIYKPFFDWTKYGYNMWKSKHPDYTTLDTWKGALKIVGYQLKSIKQLSNYYWTLSPTEQAAAQKWAQHVAVVLTVMTASLLLGRLQDEDEDLRQNNAYVLLTYELSALFKEVVEPVPGYGWWSTTSTFKESAFVGEAVLINTLKLGRYTLMGAYADEDKLYYDRGVYKGQLKRDVALKKAIPIVRQIEKQINLKANSNFYSYYNPFN